MKTAKTQQMGMDAENLPPGALELPPLRPPPTRPLAERIAASRPPPPPLTETDGCAVAGSAIANADGSAEASAMLPSGGDTVVSKGEAVEQWKLLQAALSRC